MPELYGGDVACVWSRALKMLAFVITRDEEAAEEAGGGAREPSPLLAQVLLPKKLSHVAVYHSRIVGSTSPGPIPVQL